MPNVKLKLTSTANFNCLKDVEYVSTSLFNSDSLVDLCYWVVIGGAVLYIRKIADHPKSFASSQARLVRQVALYSGSG